MWMKDYEDYERLYMNHFETLFLSLNQSTTKVQYFTQVFAICDMITLH